MKFHQYSLSPRLSAAGEADHLGLLPSFCRSVWVKWKDGDTERPLRDSASGSSDKAPSQQLDPAVDPSSYIDPLTLRCHVFLLFFPRLDFLSLPTSLSPHAVSSSVIIIFNSPWFPVLWWHLDQSRWWLKSAAWGLSVLPGVTWVDRLVGPTSVRPRPVWFDDARKKESIFPTEWGQTAGACVLTVTLS